ncbi:hypothetical protein [Streptomyces sp. LUP30]|uniref:hypothetical protein n=1 Tax=Streptomyces sp. LUP30 TaxID=1890285 RepID=UPI00159F0866|nr:hypothetical protein [Streptomyces sp. LUP30]
MNHASFIIVLSLVLLVSALSKLRRQESMLAALRGVGVPDSWLARPASVQNT